MKNDTECYYKRPVLECITTRMSTRSGDNAERNLFNVRPATENVRSDGVDELGMHKYLSAIEELETVPLCSCFSL